MGRGRKNPRFAGPSGALNVGPGRIAELLGTSPPAHLLKGVIGRAVLNQGMMPLQNALVNTAREHGAQFTPTRDTPVLVYATEDQLKQATEAGVTDATNLDEFLESLYEREILTRIEGEEELLLDELVPTLRSLDFLGNPRQPSSKVRYRLWKSQVRQEWTNINHALASQTNLNVPSALDVFIGRLQHPELRTREQITPIFAEVGYALPTALSLGKIGVHLLEFEPRPGS